MAINIILNKIILDFQGVDTKLWKTSVEVRNSSYFIKASRRSFNTTCRAGWLTLRDVCEKVNPISGKVERVHVLFFGKQCRNPWYHAWRHLAYLVISQLYRKLFSVARTKYNLGRSFLQKGIAPKLTPLACCDGQDSNSCD